MTVREKQMWTDLSWPPARQIDDYIFTLLGKQYPMVVVAEAYEKLPFRLVYDYVSNSNNYWNKDKSLFEERKNFILTECSLRYKQREQQQRVTLATVAVWTEEMAIDWELYREGRDRISVPRSVQFFLDKLSQNEIVTASAMGRAAAPSDVHRKIELEFI